MNIKFTAPLFNDVFLPYLDTDYDYEIYYGGAGSGKSKFLVQKLIIKCLKQDYFRLLYCRKTMHSIRGSCFQLFKDTISEWKLDSFFTIKKSTMEIICSNGNMMIPRGLDDVEKVKSIAGITDVWVEEPTECEQSDLDQLDLRLRDTKGKMQYFLTFNPIEETHWIRSRYIPEEADGERQYSYTLKLEDDNDQTTELKTLIVHSTYSDNKFLPKKYLIKLEALAASNPNFYQVYKLGKWGKMDIDRPYAFNFDIDKHVSTRAIYKQGIPLRFMFDFNVDPYVCVAAQMWTDSQGEHCHFIKEFEIKNANHTLMTDQIRQTFGEIALSSALFTGDATGRARHIGERDNTASWQTLKKLLNISANRLQVPSVNPSVSNSKESFNFILYHHPDLCFHPSMKTTIHQLRYTETDREGNILKKDRNKKEQQADGLDCVRYGFNVWLPDYIRRAKLK